MNPEQLKTIRVVAAVIRSVNEAGEPIVFATKRKSHMGSPSATGTRSTSGVRGGAENHVASTAAGQPVNANVDSNAAGLWEFPGGKIEPGETPQEALVREIREELDAEIRVGELIRTIEFDYPSFHLSMDCFWCELASDHIELKEHESARWLTKNNLRSLNWLPADLTIIDEIEEAM